LFLGAQVVVFQLVLEDLLKSRVVGVTNHIHHFFPATLLRPPSELLQPTKPHCLPQIEALETAALEHLTPALLQALMSV
jgi:hypothetical protein